jgi:hypothetical protein
MMLILAKVMKIEMLGNYSFLIIILIAIQNISDTSIRTFFMTSNIAGFTDSKVFKVSKKYALTGCGLMAFAVFFVQMREQIPSYFYLLVGAPIGWLFTQRIHIQAMRSEENHNYFKIRLSVEFLMNSICIISLIKYHAIISLIFLQLMIEPIVFLFSIKFLQFSPIMEQTEFTLDKKFRGILHKIQILSFANWCISLLDRFSISFFIPPRVYGIWTLASLISKSGMEALGIGISSVLRKKLLNNRKHFENDSVRLIFQVMVIGTISICVYIIALRNFLNIYFPLLVGFENVCLLFLISAEIQVVFGILNAKRIFHGDLKRNFEWAIWVTFFTPVYIFVGRHDLTLACLCIVARDLIFILKDVSKLRMQPVKFSIMLLFIFQIGLALWL